MMTPGDIDKLQKECDFEYMKENSIKDRINILKIECYITINDEKEPILNIGTSFSNMIESEEIFNCKWNNFRNNFNVCRNICRNK